MRFFAVEGASSASLAPGDGPSSHTGGAWVTAKVSEPPVTSFRWSIVIRLDPPFSRSSSVSSSASRLVPSVKRPYQVPRFTPEGVVRPSGSSPDRRICYRLPPPERDATGRR
jgi:hypothetical protein